MRKSHFLFTTLASLTCATGAFAQVVPEIEPNSGKSEATPVVGIAAGGMITGTTTGAIDTLGSTAANTVDVFRVKTGALAPGLYQHRLTLTSATVGHTGTIRGQGGHTGTACTTGGTVVPGDQAAQTSLTTGSPPRQNIWYGFGNQEEIYYRVDGTASTTAAYAAVMSTTPVTPTVIAPAFDSNGPITISTEGLTFTDTEIVLYNSAGTLVGQNDNVCPNTSFSSQSKLTRTLTPGTYYLAVTTYELCVDQPAPVDDAFFGVLIDFPGAVVLSYQSGAFSDDWDFEVRGCNGSVSVVNQSPINSPFVVTWFQLTASPGAPAISTPANNACASATVLTAPTTLTASISTATNDGTATCDAGGTGSKDVWYSFTNTAGTASLFKVNTCTSSTDTVVSVYNGCGGSEIVCNDDCSGSPCGGPGSCVSTLLAVNQTVLVRVSDKALGGCEFTLNLTNIPVPPANDDCSTPAVLSGLGSLNVSNASATTGTQGQTEAICNQIFNSNVNQDVWYTWLASNSGTVELTTCGGLAPGGGSQDTKIAVYAGTGCPAPGTAIACNDDDPAGCGGFASKLTFNAVCGTSYTFQFGMYPGTSATYTGTLAISSSGPACPPPGIPFCLGDGTGTPCPCTPIPNNGAPGRGCGSVAFPGGAILSISGNPSDESTSGPSADTFVLTATDIPGPALFIQSNGIVAPVPFGDGQLCAAIGIIRLGVVFPTAGVASYPGGTTPNEIHLQGLASAGQTKHYQAWYRSVPGVCNPGSNFDLTQGLSVVWGP